MTPTVVHISGVMSAEGTQPCVRCGELLSDYRNAMVLDGTGPLRGWEVGVAIYRCGNETSVAAITDTVQPCRPR